MVAERPIDFGVVGRVLLDVPSCAHIVRLESVHMRFVLVVYHARAPWLGNGFDIILSSKSCV